MIDQERAREIVQEKLADNLAILDSFENKTQWCFGLGLVKEDGRIMPLLGDSMIRVNKETGEIE